MQKSPNVLSYLQIGKLWDAAFITITIIKLENN